MSPSPPPTPPHDDDMTICASRSRRQHGLCPVLSSPSVLSLLYLPARCLPVLGPFPETSTCITVCLRLHRRPEKRGWNTCPVRSRHTSVVVGTPHNTSTQGLTAWYHVEWAVAGVCDWMSWFAPFPSLTSIPPPWLLLSDPGASITPSSGDHDLLRQWTGLRIGLEAGQPESYKRGNQGPH